MSNQRTYNILLGAHISEKSTIVADESNQFVFKVAKDASRPEIKRAVEQIYGVNVDSVSVANVKGKVKRTMRGCRSALHGKSLCEESRRDRKSTSRPKQVRNPAQQGKKRERSCQSLNQNQLHLVAAL